MHLQKKTGRTFVRPALLFFRTSSGWSDLALAFGRTDPAGAAAGAWRFLFLAVQRFGLADDADSRRQDVLRDPRRFLTLVIVRFLPRSSTFPARSTFLTGEALPPFGNFTFPSLGAIGSLRTFGSIQTFGSLRTFGPLLALGTFRPLRTLLAFRTVTPAVLPLWPGLIGLVIGTINGLAVQLHVLAVIVLVAALALILEARPDLSENAEIMLGELQIIFGLDPIARQLRVTRQALVFLKQLRRIATLTAVARTATPAHAALRTRSPTAATATVLTIVHQMLVPCRTGACSLHSA